MPRITVSVDIEAPLDRVWEAAADLASHHEWMADAESIEFLTEQRRGVGTRLRVATRVGPLRTSDVMEVTEWDEPHRIGVHHQGLVSGHGAFELTVVDGGTRFTWQERLSFPWYLGGPLAGWAAAPVLGWIWRRNLRRLKGHLEGAS